MKKLMLGLVAAFAVTAFAAPSVKINKVETANPWVSGEGKIMVDYSLAGIYEEAKYKVVFEISAGGKTASVTNDAAKLIEGKQQEKAIDTVTLFGKEIVDKDAKVKITLISVFGGVQLWEGGPFFAECNVGATKPEEYGWYFWWGDTVGYKRNANNNGWVSVKDATQTIEFASNDPTAGQTYNKNADTLKSEGWTDDSGNLVVSDVATENHDAARAHLGSPWRMMTDAELQKLVDDSEGKWVERKWVEEYNGKSVKGYVVSGEKGSAYENNEVFFPAAGDGNGSYLNGTGDEGLYWSSTPDSSDCAQYLYFRQGSFRGYGDRRYLGYVVRPVRGSGEESSGGGETVVATADADFWLGPGCKSCPWTVGEGVTAYVEGDELDIKGTGEMYDFASAEDVPWADVAKEVTAVTIAEGVTQVGKNALAGFTDEVTVNGTPLSTFRKVATVETKINDMTLDDFNAAVRFLNVGEEWKEASPASSEPVIPDDKVLVAKEELQAAKAEAVSVADGVVSLGVTVNTNGNFTAETKSWAPVELKQENVKVENGKIVISIPVSDKSGFMILQSGDAKVSEGGHGPVIGEPWYKPTVED